MRQSGNVLAIILAIIAALAIAGGAYFYGQNQSLKKATQTPEMAATSTPYSQNPLPYASPTSAPSSKATVVYEAEGSFTASEKDELKKKVIDPFLDYYTTESTQVLLTLTIARNSQASKDTYPYTGQAIFQGGGNMGFLIMKVGTGVDWWFPECLNGCNLSAAYKAKYPEIALKVQ